MCKFVHTGPNRYVGGESSLEKAAEGLFLAFFQERGAQAPFSELSVCWIDRAGGASVRKNKVRVLPMGDEDQAKNPRGFKLGVQPGSNETGRVVIVTLPKDAFSVFGVVHPDACRAVEESVLEHYPSVRENWDMSVIRAKMGIVDKPKTLTEKEKILRNAIEVLKTASDGECGEVIRLQFLLAAHEALVPWWEAQFEETKRRVLVLKDKMEKAVAAFKGCHDSVGGAKKFPESVRQIIIDSINQKSTELDIAQMAAASEYEEAVVLEHNQEELIIEAKNVSKFAANRLREVAEEEIDVK